MNSGTVGAVLIHEANPAYNYYDSKRFVDGLKKVKLAVSFNPKMDETTALCKYVIPNHHYLESWGDAEVKTGNTSLLQPTIYPLFKTRQWQDRLLKWSASPVDYLAFYKQYWSTKLGGESNWDKALQDGVINGGVSRNTILTTPTSGNPDTAKSVNFTGTVLSGLSGGGKATSSPFNAASVSQAATALASIKKGGAYELVLYEKVTIGSGQQANNPWLQETPDPITKATWDNYVIISPATAKNLFKIDLQDKGDTDDYEVHPEKQVIKITSNGNSIELPIIIVPGTNPNTIAIAFGYGRGVNSNSDDNDEKGNDQVEKARTNIGRAGGATGKNVYPLVTFNGLTRSYSIPSVEVAPPALPILVWLFLPGRFLFHHYRRSWN